MKITNVGEGKVVLIAGGGKIYTDIAARFVRSERGIEDIIASPYDKGIVENIINSGHKACTEFDYFIFGAEGYSRVSEVQLVRKRLASYMIKSGRADKNGKRGFDVVIPKSIEDFDIKIPLSDFRLHDEDGEYSHSGKDMIQLNTTDILNILELWYNNGVETGLPEEELRYMKPQATEYKAIIGMNAHALLDWFQIRCCKNAQTEIRDMANKMLKLCKQVAPDLFKNAGPSCINLGYCPENKLQNKECVGNMITKNEAIKILKNYKKIDIV